MANAAALTLQTAGTQTLSGTGAAVEIGTLRQAAKLTLDVTAASGGTPALTVLVETSPTGGTGSWKTATTFTPASAVGYQKTTVAPLERFARAKWTITGTTPSFTFALAGEAHVIYATPDDLPALALPADALTNAPADKAAAMIAISSFCDSYLGAVYTMPLLAWGDDLRRCAAHLAAYDLMVTRGYSPEGPDENLRDRYDDAIKWLSRLADGGLAPPDIVDSEPEAIEASAYIYTESRRGW